MIQKKGSKSNAKCQYKSTTTKKKQWKMKKFSERRKKIHKIMMDAALKASWQSKRMMKKNFHNYYNCIEKFHWIKFYSTEWMIFNINHTHFINVIMIIIQTHRHTHTHRKSQNQLWFEMVGNKNENINFE